MNTPSTADGPSIGLLQLLVWLGAGKRIIGWTALAALLISLALALLATPVYTARATVLPPGGQTTSSSAAALAAIGGLTGSFAAKSPDEMYVALLKSDSVVRALDQRFDLKKRYAAATNETLRRAIPGYVRISADKKSGLIGIDVDDEDPKFAAELANAHVSEVAKVLDRLAVSEAKLRRVFFEKQLGETKERLVKAEQDLQRVQEKSGVIVLDKQAEALITSAAQVRALIADREVQLKVLRTSATEQNPDVVRLNSELRAMRAELARMESAQGGTNGSAVDLPVGRLPEAAMDYVRARREVKLQETLLESMVRQFEIAKLDEAKEGQALQPVDVAVPPDYKSKPSRALIVVGLTLLATLAAAVWVLLRGYLAFLRSNDAQVSVGWDSLRQAWRFRR